MANKPPMSENESDDHLLPRLRKSPDTEKEDVSTETAPPRAPTNLPDQIGPYKILERIGEGGMGTVYVAEQRKPVRRRVALKVIKLGMDTKQVLARFEVEHHALAIMNHPNIARVYDAGATAEGRPYFVMEHVQGIPIKDYCDQNRLPNRQRLDLFVKVCQGVQHAHQKGVIHQEHHRWRGAKIVRRARYVTFQLAEVAIPRDLFRGILSRIRSLADAVPVPSG